jgi:hypothetical protein
MEYGDGDRDGDVDVDEMDETGYATLSDSAYGSPPPSPSPGMRAPTSINRSPFTTSLTLD